MTTSLLLVVAVVLLTIGVSGVAVGLVGTGGSALRVAFSSYGDTLERELVFLRSPVPASRVMLFQALGLAVVIGLGFWLAKVLWLFAPLVLIGPLFQLRTLRERRILRIEQQLDGFLLVLANALKAVPAIGDALSSSQALMHAPISEELDVALKEYGLGTPLDRALQNMGSRIGSRVVRTAITTLQVARKTGGNLPLTLESSAASLREMARLEGVVRTKTADGRNQAFVIGSLPGILIVLLYFVHPDLIEPLVRTNTGNILLGISIVLWAGAVLLALRILKVDI
jgi:tight adherence protein B